MKDREGESASGVIAGAALGDDWDDLVSEYLASFQARRRRPKTFWHFPYAGLIVRRKPPSWEAVVELILSLGPRWADLLLLRRTRAGNPDAGARVMRGLWPLLTDVALLELKGPTSGVRKLDLARLVSYGWEYVSKADNPVDRPSQLSLVLAVPGDTPTLRAEYDRCGFTPEPLGGGYVRLHGSPFCFIVVLMDEVADSEDDDFLRVFTSTRMKIRDPAAQRWMYTHVTTGVTMEGIKHLEGFDDMVETLARVLGPAGLVRIFGADEVIHAWGVEEFLRHVSAEERLAGLQPEQVLDVLRSLPGDVLERIRKDLDESQDDQ